MYMVTFLRRARFLPSTLANIKVGSCSISMQQAPQKQHRTCGRELTCAQANWVYYTSIEYYTTYNYESVELHRFWAWVQIVLCDLEGNNVSSYSRVYLFNILTILVYSKLYTRTFLKSDIIHLISRNFYSKW